MKNSEMDAKDRYIDLLKGAVSFSLWTQPPAELNDLSRRRPGIRRRLIVGRSEGLLGALIALLKDVRRVPLELLSSALRPLGLGVYKKIEFSEADVEEGLMWPVYGETMIGLNCLDNLQNCVEVVIREEVPGDLIETGVWRGGACIFMRGILAAHGVKDRRVFVADSFQGLPPPGEEFPEDSADHFSEFDYLAVDEAEVRRNFERYGLLDDQVVFLPGFFSETLPSAPITELAILRLDGDMYSSTIDALSNLYPKLSKGGFVIVDDYAIRACRTAITDFRRDNGIEDDLVSIDQISVFWRKS